ncbi:hypothetical protein HK104_005710 [Borealophlyctis nickersoniae]|nr:hypothetical protein HK104_005710 [Borealophlyctis nickersoniae]
MGGGDFLTPKAIANRIKAKGLQKLRWYCQMCQKQCRDENGFKCHCTSEGHIRMMQLFAESPDKYLNDYSQEFLSDFMKLFSRRHNSKRVHANLVYQEYISDRNHLHMNATRWDSLSSFVQYLGREGLAEVDETPKGWFIKYIDRSPATLARQEAVAKKERMERTEEEREQKLLQEQIEKAKEVEAQKAEEQGITVGATELKREDEGAPIKLQLQTKGGFKIGGAKKVDAKIKKPNPLAATFKKPVVPKVEQGAKTENGAKTDGSAGSAQEPKKLSAVEQIIQEEMARKRKFVDGGGSSSTGEEKRVRPR